MYISLIVKAPLEWYLPINSDFYFKKMRLLEFG